MPLETWGTFSVRDHRVHRAFVADVLLYDRLVIPFPIHPSERERWRTEGWEPDLLERKIEILGEDLVQIIPWDPHKREMFADRMKAARAVDQDTRALSRKRCDEDDPFGATRMILSDLANGYESAEDLEFARKLPGVYVDAVAAFPSYDAYRREVPPEQDTEDGRVFGWEVLVPEDADLDDDALLKEAVVLARDPTFRAKRTALNEWRRELAHYDANVEDIRADIEKRLSEYHEALRREKMRQRVLNAFALVGIGTAIGGAVVFPPVAVAGGFVAAGRFIAEKSIGPEQPSDEAKAVAIIHDARRHFGWR